MSLFNKAAAAIRKQRYGANPAATKSHGGGTLYQQNAETELYLQVCTMMFADKYYETGSASMERMRELIHKCDRKYVLQLAAFARNEMKMRSAPQMLLAEASMMYSGSKEEAKADVRKYAPHIIRRADEPAEVLAYWINYIGNNSKAKLPNALRRGIADAIGEFDEYQLSKYNRSSSAIKLKDVFRLVHPKPKNAERQELYRRVMADELAPETETWEQALSAAGQNGTSKKDAWNSVAPSMGMMALLRNIRNFQDEEATEAINIACQRFRNAEDVRKSRLLPMRWYQAYKYAKTSQTRDALAMGLEHSLALLPKLHGNIAIVTDSSGSMGSRLNNKSTLTYLEVGAIMSGLAVHLIDADAEYTVGHFADRYEEIPISRRDSVLTNIGKVVEEKNKLGWGTNANSILLDWIQKKKVVDYFLLFSDMQVMNAPYTAGFAELWDRYRRKVNPKAVLFSFDLAGYGQGGLTPQGEKGCYQMAGFSEKVFSFMEAVEDTGSAITAIKAI